MATEKKETVPKKCKAVVYQKFGDPDVLKVEEVETIAPGEGEIVIQVKAAGVNPADAKIRLGGWKYPCDLPAVPGWDAAGVVVERGHAARRFNVGDEVYGYVRRPNAQHGCTTQYLTCSESYAALKPKKLNWDQAGGLPLAGLTALQGLKLLGLKEGQSILVVGASGGVGGIVTQLAAHVFKAKHVIGVASSKSADIVRKFGATAAIDYKGDWKAEVLKIVGDGVDAVYDCFGSDWGTQVEAVCKDGSHVVSIASWTPPKYTKKIHFQAFLVEPNSRELEDLASYCDSGKLSVHVDKVWKMDEASKAHADILSGHTSGKAVIKIE